MLLNYFIWISLLHYSVPLWLGHHLVCVTWFLLCSGYWSCYMEPRLHAHTTIWIAHITFLVTCAIEHSFAFMYQKLLAVASFCFFVVLFSYSFLNDNIFTWFKIQETQRQPRVKFLPCTCVYQLLSFLARMN